MKVSAALIAITAVVAVSAAPAPKQAAVEPITDANEPAVRANLKKGVENIGQAIYDSGREANANIVAPVYANVVAPTEKFTSNAIGYGAHGSASVIKRASAGGFEIAGNTARGISNIVKKTADTADRLFAENLYSGADYLRGGARASEAAQKQNEAALAEQKQYAADRATEAAEAAEDAVHRKAQSARETAQEIRDRAQAKTNEAKEAAKDVRDDAANRSTGFFSSMKSKFKAGEKAVAAKVQAGADAVSDVAEDVKEDSAEKEVRYAKEADAKRNGGASSTFTATAGIVAALAAAAITLA